MLKNVEVIRKLTHKQSKAIILLLEGNSVEEVAKAVGCAVNTIYRYLEREDFFIKAYTEAKDKVFNEALEDLKIQSREAVKTLKDLLLRGHKDTARLGSAKVILEVALRIKEIKELEERIKALEERLK